MIHKIKKILPIFLKYAFTFGIVAIFFHFTPKQNLYALSHEWVEVPMSDYGQQYWDKKSIIRNKDGSFRLNSKFVPKTKSEITKDIFYTMDINCIEKSFKDVNVTTQDLNEFINLKADWEDPNGDKLIIGVISQVCSFEE